MTARATLRSATHTGGRRASWLLAGVLTFLLAAVLVLPVPVEAARTLVLDEVAIAVNDRAMTRREVEEIRRIQAQELRQQFKGAELQTKLQALETELTERLVEDMLLESHAERLGINISDEVIEERVDNILRRQPNLQDLYTDAQLKAYVLKELLRRQVISREVDSRIRVTDEEVTETCRRQNLRQTEVDVGHILIRGDVPNARTQVEAIRQQLVEGADFEKLALEYSQDPSVKTNKGHLGFISRGQFVKPFEDAAFALPVGAVSEPVRTQFGWHLVKVFDQRSKGAVDCDKLDDVAQQALRNRIYSERHEERMQAFLKRLKDQADIRVATNL